MAADNNKDKVNEGYDPEMDPFYESKMRAVRGCNAELGTKFKTLDEMDLALKKAYGRRYDIILKWLCDTI